MKLSYIIPMYNSVRFIDKAIKSCLSQDVPFDFEVICCDDGSQDNTFNYVFDRYKTEKRVRVYHHMSNMGQTAARRTCFDVATGEWFFTLDHDNVLPAGTMKVLFEYGQAKGLDAISPEALYFFKNGNLTKLSSWVFKFQNNMCDFSVMIKTTTVPPSGGQYLFHREVYEKVGGYPELTEDSHGDWAFGFKHVAAGYNIGICPNTFYWHQHTENSMFYGMNLKKWYNQIAVILRKYIYRFDDESQKLIERCENGHELINSGKLRLR